MRTLKILSLILVIVGAVNWGLWGLFQFDLVATLFNGNASVPSRIVYTLVGLAGVLRLATLGEDIRDSEEPHGIGRSHKAAI